MGRDYQTYKLLEDRSNREKFRARPVLFRPAPDDIHPVRPKYILRALYGPIVGKVASSIVSFPYEEALTWVLHDSPAQPIFTINDRFGKWGPREFLHNFSHAVVRIHGDGVALFTHNHILVEIDAGTFHTWIDLINRDPVTCLVDPTKVFGTDSHERFET